MFILGTVLVLTKVSDKLKGGILYQTVDMIGKATSPLSMIFIGLVLAGAKNRLFQKYRKEIYRDYDVCSEAADRPHSDRSDTAVCRQTRLVSDVVRWWL